MDWNDLRYFVAVAEQGSTLKAGRALRVSQTTVARRIAALEDAIGLSLFERRAAGYALTPDGEGLLRHARQVSAAAEQFSQAAGSRTRDLSGTVKLTTQDIFMVLLAPMLRDLYERHPDILIELDEGQDMRDLGAGEADIALRSVSEPRGGGVYGRRLCADDWTLYCSREYAEKNGVPTTREELQKHAFIGGGGGGLWKAYSAWLHDLGLEERVVMHPGSATGMLSAIRSGLGIAVLPTILGDSDPDLVRCIPPKAHHMRSLWLLTHDRVRHTPRVRAVIDFLYERLSGHVRMLEAQEAA
jgi:DNA-binding transcriptional LysR family regulator